MKSQENAFAIQLGEKKKCVDEGKVILKICYGNNAQILAARNLWYRKLTM